MGFSVSGGFAVLVVGTFIAFGIFYGATANAGERVTDAQQAAFEDRLDQQNTAIDVTTATWYDGNTTLTVEVENTGETALSVDDTDLLADNDYLSRPFAAETVDGDGATDLWLPGEELRVEADLAGQPDRLTVVTERGIADGREVV
jgi:flagellar protein FlaF